MLRPSPFGVIVGAVLLVAAALPALVGSDTAAHRDPGAAALDHLADELEAAQNQIDDLTQALGLANARLAAAGQRTVSPSTSTSVPGSAPQRPQERLAAGSAGSHAGDQPAASEPAVPGGNDAPPGTASTVQPTTTTTTAPAPPTTTIPPQPPGACPPGYHPVVKVGVPPLGSAIVCLRDRSKG